VSDLAQADPSGSPVSRVGRLLRDRAGLHRVTNIELVVSRYGLRPTPQYE